ncbi:alpha/beta fold hydrolase [Rhodococcus koreensis]
MSETCVTEVPEWFHTALRSPAEEVVVTVDGARIVCRAWGEPDAPGVVLVHGSAANARWWDHIAPHLSDGRRVVAVDLSGHGDSGRRPRYCQDVWAEELRTVVREVVAPHPVVIGHSMGGKVAYRAATEGMADEVGGLVLLDSNIARPPTRERAERVIARAERAPRVYPDVTSAIEAFRPFGSQRALPGYLAEHVGRHSIERAPGGWTWKFDPRVFLASPDAPPPLTQQNCPIVLIRAGHDSVVAGPAAAAAAAALGPTAQVEILSGAGHHMMFDTPMELVARVRELLAQMEASN